MVNFKFLNVSFILQNMGYKNLYMTGNSDLTAIVGQFVNATSYWYFKWDPDGEGGSWEIIHGGSCKTLIVPSQVGNMKSWDVWEENGGIRFSVHNTTLNVALSSANPGTKVSLLTPSMLENLDQLRWNYIPEWTVPYSQCPQLAGIISA